MRATWALVVFVIGLSLYRAATQSITHDEALSYLLFVDTDWRQLFRPFGHQDILLTNHVLASALAKICIGLAGPSEVAMRAPTLVGAVLYAVAWVGIAKRLFSSAAAGVTLVALLTLNPYVLDFLSAARGYGLALGLLSSALYVFLPGGPFSPRVSSLIGGVLLGLSVAANLTSSIPAVSILAAAMVFGWLRRGAADAVRMTAASAAIAASVALPFVHFTLLRAGSKEYYVGTNTVLEWVAALIHAGWRHQGFEWTTVSSIAAAERPLAIIVLAVLAVAVVLSLRRLSPRPADLGVRDAAAFMAVVVVTGFAGLVAAHWLVGLRYPLGRTGLYWIPFATATVVFAIAAERPRGALRVIAALAVAVVLFQYLRLLQVTVYADWDFDASDRAIIALIEADHRRSPRRVTIGGSWQFEPALNFYRVVRRLDWIEPVERRPPAPGSDYYVFRRDEVSHAAALGLVPVFVDERVGTLLAIPGLQARKH